MSSIPSLLPEGGSEISVSFVAPGVDPEQITEMLALADISGLATGVDAGGITRWRLFSGRDADRSPAEKIAALFDRLTGDVGVWTALPVTSGALLCSFAGASESQRLLLDKEIVAKMAERGLSLSVVVERS